MSNDPDVHVSTVSTQPAGLLAGTVISHKLFRPVWLLPPHAKGTYVASARLVDPDMDPDMDAGGWKHAGALVPEGVVGGVAEGVAVLEAVGKEVTEAVAMALNVGVKVEDAERDEVCDGAATLHDSVYEPEAPSNPATSTAYLEPGVAAMLTRDCRPQASSLEDAQPKFAPQLAA